MEINIKNAFRIAVKSSYRPCLGKYRIFAEKIEELTYEVTLCFLEKPLFSTVIFSIFSIFLVTILSTILLILIGVLFCILTIFLVESFVALLFLVTVCTIMSVIGFIITILTITGTEYKMQRPA